jgi:hypothetical protein
MLLENEMRIKCTSVPLIVNDSHDNLMPNIFRIFVQSEARHHGIRFPKPKGSNGTLHQANIRVLSDRNSCMMIIGISSDT